jgi:hypothetical protein
MSEFKCLSFHFYYLNVFPFYLADCHFLVLPLFKSLAFASKFFNLNKITHLSKIHLKQTPIHSIPYHIWY